MNNFVTSDGIFKGSGSSNFNLIDNYIYLYHTGTFIVLPTFPEDITDSMATSFSPTSIMSRSAPIFSYSGSGPRSIDIQLKLHRDMMNDINTSLHTTSNINVGMALFSNDKDISTKIQRKDYVDLMINELQSIAFPSYMDSQKMVNPPLVAIRIGDEIYCKGIVDGGVTTHFSGPILANPIYDPITGEEQFIKDNDGIERKLIGKGKYAVVDISFKITEVDPYDASIVAQKGSFRGLNTTLERNLYKVGG